MNDKDKQKVTEFINHLSNPQLLYDALLTYNKFGICSLIPCTNLTFLINFEIMTEKGTDKNRLTEIINFLKIG